MAKRQHSAKHSLYRRPRKAARNAAWERISAYCYPLQQARVHYQDRLIRNALGELDPEYTYRLRRIEMKPYTPKQGGQS